MPGLEARVASAALAALALLAAVPASAGGKDDAKYAADVEFLLDELGKKAATLLRQKGIDWKAVDKEFRAAAKAVKSDGEHLVLCQRLVARLQDGHAGLLECKAAWPDESKGRKWTGPRVHLCVTGAKGETVLVQQAWGQAEQAGLAPGMEVVKIDGKPARAWLDAKVAEMRDTNGYSTAQQALYAACHWGLAGWEETRIEFDAVKDGKKVDAKVSRSGGSNFVPEGPVFPPKDLKTIGRQSWGRTAAGFGYIHLRDAPGELPEQLDAALEGIGDVPGMILDCRANGGGGCDHAAVFGRFVAPGAVWRQYKSAGKKPYAGPMVVIVDAGVRSAGETVSGQFKEDGRAYMIGDSATAGMSSQKETVKVPSGLFSVLFSVASNKGRFNGGKGIEGMGVPPHEIVPYDAADLAKGVDTEIRRAEELLAKGFPKGVVPYEPK